MRRSGPESHDIDAHVRAQRRAGAREAPEEGLVRAATAVRAPARRGDARHGRHARGHHHVPARRGGRHDAGHAPRPAAPPRPRPVRRRAGSSYGAPPPEAHHQRTPPRHAASSPPQRPARRVVGVRDGRDRRRGHVRRRARRQFFPWLARLAVARHRRRRLVASSLRFFRSRARTTTTPVDAARAVPAVGPHRGRAEVGDGFSERLALVAPARAQRHGRDAGVRGRIASSTKVSEPSHAAGMTPDSPREVHYFDALAHEENASATWREYLARFPLVTADEAASGVATLDKSPSYARFPRAVAAMRFLVPSAHVVVVLREPVDRAYSAFAHHAKRDRFCRERTSSSSSSSSAVRTCVETSSATCRYVVYDLVDAAKRRYRRRCGASSTSLRRRSHHHATEASGSSSSAAQTKPISCSPCRAKDFDDYVRSSTVLAATPPAPTTPPLTATWSKRVRGPLDVVADGDYLPQVRSLFANFPARQIHVLLFDHVVADPLGALDELQRRVGLPYHDFEPQLRIRRGHFDVAPSRVNPLMEGLRGLFDLSGTASGPDQKTRDAPPRDREPMRASTRALLRDFYAPNVDALWDLLKDLKGDAPFLYRPPQNWPTERVDDVPPRRRHRSDFGGGASSPSSQANHPFAMIAGPDAPPLEHQQPELAVASPPLFAPPNNRAPLLKEQPPKTTSGDLPQRAFSDDAPVGAAAEPLGALDLAKPPGGFDLPEDDDDTVGQRRTRHHYHGRHPYVRRHRRRASVDTVKSADDAY
mmetsp:Transcript_16577/g.66901  ORF Transcript_16577/g.66901 Transcript_16577/m.66901 type:complete len:760 (+) Transcript_16577:37-2316(+)